MTTRDRFIGAWRVLESVYAPEGRFLGFIRQRRILEDLGAGRTRVTQICTPEPPLEAHPMGRFAGSWVFELEREGHARRYLGPDVLGSGFAHGPSAMTGRGVWPRFGHGSTSFSVLSDAGQWTGGCFWNANQLVARIIGVAMPEGAEEVWPAPISGPAWPGDVSPLWRGTIEAFSSDGRPLRAQPLRRRYENVEGSAALVEEAEDGGAPAGALAIKLEAEREGRHRVAGRAHGIPCAGVASRAGGLLDLELVVGPRVRVEWMEIFDPGSQRVVALRRRLEDEIPMSTEVIRLEPAR